MTECSLHKIHNPSVSRLDKMPVLPAFLQERARAKGKRIKRDYTTAAAHVCPTGKANVEEYTRYLLGERLPLDVRVGKETKDAAQAAVFAYEATVTRK